MFLPKWRSQRLKRETGRQPVLRMKYLRRMETGETYCTDRQTEGSWVTRISLESSSSSSPFITFSSRLHLLLDNVCLQFSSSFLSSPSFSSSLSLWFPTNTSYAIAIQHITSPKGRTRTHNYVLYAISFPFFSSLASPLLLSAFLLDFSSVSHYDSGPDVKGGKRMNGYINRSYCTPRCMVCWILLFSTDRSGLTFRSLTLLKRYDSWQTSRLGVTDTAKSYARGHLITKTWA